MVSVDQAFGTMPITMMVFLIQIPSYATTRVAMFHVFVEEIPLCALAKTIFQHPILLLSYRPIKNITNHYETFFHLFVMNSFNFPHRTFLHLRCFKRINLLFRFLSCLLPFQVIKCLSALFC